MERDLRRRIKLLATMLERLAVVLKAPVPSKEVGPSKKATS